MKTWLKFIIIPVITMWVLELLSAFIFAGDPDSFSGLASSFIIYFCGGVLVYQLAPESNKKLYSMIYSVIYIAIGFYLGIITDGNVIELMGERVVQEFLILPEIVKSAGILLGVFGIYQSEMDENNKEKTA